MFEISRVDAEALSYKESSPLAGSKYFSELRKAESDELAVAGVKISFNFKSVSLEASAIRCPRKEEVLRSSSNYPSGKFGTT